MISLTRRLVLRQPFQCISTSHNSALRWLHTSSQLHAKPARRPVRLPPNLPKNGPPPRPTQSRSASPSLTAAKRSSSPPVKASPVPAYATYASQLAQKPNSTLLYESPSLVGYTVFAYSTAIACYFYAAFVYATNVRPDIPDLAPFVQPAFAVVGIFFVVLGTRFALAPRHIIRRITAVPGADKTLQLHFEIRKMLPLLPGRFSMPPRIIRATLEECRLKGQIYAPSASEAIRAATTATERRAIADVERMRVAALEEAEKYERSHLLTHPFRRMSMGLFRVAQSAGRIFHRQGFMDLEIQGSKYKVDVTGGWALDAGRALDRLLGVRRG